MKHFRTTIQNCAETNGIARRKQAYIALTYLKRLGKGAGYNAQMIQLLDYYLSFTKDVDWQEGRAAIVFQPLMNTARDFALSTRQIQRIEAALNEKGLISWHDSPNKKRYGRRGTSGHLEHAFGVDLSPLINTLPMLEQAITQKEAQDKEWRRLKKAVHSQRKQILDLLKENDLSAKDIIKEEGISALSMPIRAQTRISKLQTIINALHIVMKQLKNLRSAAQKNLQNVDKNVAHKKNTNNSNINKTMLSEIGLGKITLTKVKNYLSAKKWDRSITFNLNNWHDLIEFSHKNHRYYGLSDAIWGRAQHKLTPIGASLSFLVLVSGVNRPDNQIKCPEAYFIALLKRAEQGGLHLDRSFYA